MRCFVAIELDDGWRRVLASVRPGASAAQDRDVKWVGADALHITLKFLGELPDAQVARAAAFVDQAAARIAPFTLRLGPLGAFPSRGMPRVLWAAALDDAQGCARWVAAADSLLAELGVMPEQRPYTPHVTLARSKSATGGRALERLVQSAAGLPPLELRVAAITLFESELSPRGPRYTPLHRAVLGSTGSSQRGDR